MRAPDVRVVVDRGHQGARALDARCLERFEVGRVAGDDCRTLARRFGQRRFVAVDDDVRHALLGELLGDRPSDAAVAAQDQMVLHPTDAPPHALALEHLAEMSLDDVCHQRQHGIGEDAEADRDDPDRPPFAGPVERCRLSVADRRDRGDGHVERVEPRPVLEHDVSRRARADYQHE